MLDHWQPSVPIPHLGEFCQQIGIGKPAQQLLRRGLTPRQYFGVLLDRKKYPDAIRFQVHVLPRRNALWWGCLCVQRVAQPDSGPKQAAALQAAVRWVLDPNEMNRRSAEVTGKAAGMNTLAGGLAMCVFWGEGSIVPAGQREVLADPLLMPGALSGVILMGGGEVPPDKAFAIYEEFLAVGIGVARERYPWQAEPISAQKKTQW